MRSDCDDDIVAVVVVIVGKSVCEMELIMIQLSNKQCRYSLQQR